MTGPLAGVSVVEIGGIGPGPFAGMVLADLGADIIRLDRPRRSDRIDARFDVTMRGRATIQTDLKHPDAAEFVLGLCERADILIEGFRPGTMERLGLGPDAVFARNPALVYGRITGYGQDGPLAQAAGHDINYISVAGALGAISRQADRPLFPLNLLGDYGGGAMFLLVGVLAGLLEARASGRGQVVDAAMVDGVAAMTALFHGMRAAGTWTDMPGTNMLDSGAHFYEVYLTADARHVAVGAIEPQFYASLLAGLGIPAEQMPQWERSRWPEFKRRLGAIFVTRTATEWARRLNGTDACCTVVNGLDDAVADAHNRARGTFVELQGVTQPSPAPRFGRTPGHARNPPAASEVLARWGVDGEQCGRWTERGLIHV